MKPTRQLHDLDESLWLDNITRYLVNSRTLKHCMDELSVVYPTTAIRVVRQDWSEHLATTD